MLRATFPSNDDSSDDDDDDEDEEEYPMEDKKPGGLRPIIAIAMAHPRRASVLALCHSRACQQQALRDPRSILVGEW